MKEIKDYIEKTDKFLRTAAYAVDIEDYGSSVSRCYYAMFFMAEAVLLTKGLSASSHKGVISMFGENFIKTRVFEKNLGKVLNDAYEKKLIGDYGVGFLITKEETIELLETAKNFVEKLTKYLEHWMETEKNT